MANDFNETVFEKPLPEKTVAYKVKKAFMKHIYESNYLEWKDKYPDERLEYCNTYEMIMGALEAIKNINNNLVWHGFDRIFYEVIEMLDVIKERFE